MIDKLEAPDLTDMGMGMNNSGGKLENYRDPLTTPINRERHIKKFLELYKNSSNDVYFCGYGGSNGINEWFDPTNEPTAKEILEINQGKHPDHENVGKKPVGASINYSEEVENYSKADEIDTLNLIYLDFDNRTGKPADKKKIGAIGDEVKELAESEQIHPLVACSGSKGFSVLIPVPHIEVEDQKELSMKIKDFLLELDSGPKIIEAEIDPKCSNLNRLVGIPGTVNNKKDYRENPETNGGYQRFWMDYNLDVPINELREKNKEFLEKSILDREVETTTKEFENTDPEEREITETKEGWKKELINYISNYGKNNEGLWTDGQRQFLALAISGFGAYYSIDQGEIEDIIIDVAKENKDEELKQRLKAVQTTYNRKKRFEEGKEEIPPTFMYHLKEILPDQEAQKIKKNWKKIIQVDQIDKDELKEKVFSLNKASWDYETEFVTFTQEINFENSDKKINYLDTYEVPKELAEKLVEQKKASYGIWECNSCSRKHYQKRKPKKCFNEDTKDHKSRNNYKFYPLHPTEPIEVGDVLLENYNFETPIESIDESSPGRIHLYENGIYDPGKAKGIIKNKVKKINHLSKQADQRHVMDHITALEQTSEKEFGLNGSRVVIKDEVLNLETLEVEPHDPSYLALSRIDIKFDPEAKCEEFKEYLKDVIPSKKDRKRLQEVLGTALVSDKFHKKGIILLGPTDAGKSTLIRIIRDVFGEENTETESPHALAHTRWAKGNLRGAKLNATDEISENKLKNIEILKRTMAGEPIKGEHKGEKRFKFTPTCEHIYAANQTPTADRKDDGFWNRWIAIEMPESVPKEDQDPDLPSEIIEKERRGIFNWIVKGYKDFIEKGKHFTHTIEWEETRDKWLGYGSALQRFIQNFIEPEKGNKITTADLYDEVVDFATEEEIDAPSSQKQVTEEVKKLPYARYSKNYTINGISRQRGLKGIKINYDNKDHKAEVSGKSTSNDREGRGDLEHLNSHNMNVEKTDTSATSGIENKKFSNKSEVVKAVVDYVRNNGEISYKDLKSNISLPKDLHFSDVWFKLRQNSGLSIDENDVLHYTNRKPQSEKVKAILDKLEDLQDDEPVHHNDLAKKVDLPTKELETILGKMKENKDILEPKNFHYKIKGEK